MSNHKDYESFMGELEILADANDIDLHLDYYDYHTYFMRGCEPQGVIDDVKALLRMNAAA